MNIEHARGDDVDAVTDMWVDLARDQRAYGSAIQAEANRAAMSETLAASVAADGLLVARVGDEPVGFASSTIDHGALELDRTRGLLTNLYVDPPYRRQGIGSALLEAVLERFDTADVDIVTLEVMAKNDAARRFYADHGFEPRRVTMARVVDR